MTIIGNDPAFRALLRYSGAIGANPVLMQVAGGNASLKCDDVLWVKVSGTWLMDAEAPPIMVPVSLSQLLAAIRADNAEAMENATLFVAAAMDTTSLRPSIETTMHALLPHPMVAHVHCVETIAGACRPAMWRRR